MGAAQVISSVSAGDQFSAGNAHVENAALGVRLEGLHSLRIPIHLVREDNGDYLQFDLASLPPPDLRFDFGDAARPLVVRGRDSSAFGDTEVENAAQAVWMEGRPPERLRAPLFAREPVRVYDLPELVPSVGVVHFRLGGGAHVVPMAGFDSFETGNALVEAPLTVAPEGWLSERISTHLVRIDNGDYIRFDFDAAGLPGLALHFTFGGPQVVAGRGLDSAAFGGIEIENAAQAAWMEGRPPERVRAFTVSDREPLWLDFVHAQEADARNLSFNFGSDRRTIPHGWEVSAVGQPSITSVVYAQGQDSAAFGEFITSYAGQVVVVGWDSSVFGQLYVPVVVDGFDSTAAFGAALVANTTREVYFDGFQHTQYGEPVVWVRETQRADLEEHGIDGLGFGDFELSHFHRRIKNVGGLHHALYGLPWAAFGTRYVHIEGDNRFFRSYPFLVGMHDDVLMASPHPLTQWGTPHVDLVRFLPEGLDSFASGNFWASFSPRALGPASWALRAFGDARVWNLRQYVRFEEPDTDADTRVGAVFGRPWRFYVTNYDRRVHLYGLNSFRTGASFGDVVRAGRAVLVQGFDSYGTQPWYRQHLVAFSERALDMPGLDSFRMVRTHMVYNGAYVLAFEGADSAVFGFGRAWRYLQTVRMSSVRYDSQGLRAFRYGLPWVAPAVRGFQMRTSRQSLQMPHIIVGHTPLRVHMEGWYSFRFTNLHTLGKPIPTIMPHWRSVDYWDLRLIGIPDLHNVTPQIYPFGRNMLRTEARHMVAFRVRDVAPEGFDSFRFENLFTMLRDRAVQMDGASNSRVSQEFDVFGSEGPGFPTQRTIAVPSLYDLIKFGFPRLSIVAIVFTPRQSDDLGPIRFGEWQITLNSVVFRRTDFPPQYMFESGEFAVSGGELRVERLSVRDALAQLSAARVTPHTIWMKPAPSQATRNHPNSRGYESASTGPSWGRVWVYLPGVMHLVQMHATDLPPSQRIGARIGDLEVDNSIRSIASESWLSFLQGYPRVITQRDRTVAMWSGGDYFDPVWGVPVVTDNGPQHVVHGGDFFGAVGSHEVQNQHRTVYMAGSDSTVWGNNTPLIYHYPRGFTPVDSDLTQWGDAWFSHAPRWRTIEGSLFFRNGWEWPNFDARMTVWNQLGIVYPHAGFDASRYGAFEVASGDATIRPYGFVRRCVTGQHEVRHV